MRRFPSCVSRAHILILLSGVLFSAASWETCALAADENVARVKIYPLTHKTAEEIEQILTQMLADQGADTQIVADQKRNRIVLQGSDRVHEVAEQVIKSLDRPSGIARGEDKPYLKPYPCPANELERRVEQLRGQYAGTPGVKVAADPTTSQLLIMAPRSIHAAIAAVLTGRQPAAEGPALRGEEPATLPRATPPLRVRTQVIQRGDASVEAAQFVKLIHTRTERVESAVKDVFGTRLQPLKNEKAAYQLQDRAGHPLEMHFDQVRNGVHISGTEASANQLAKLIVTFDSPEPGAGKLLRVVPLKGADEAKVREAYEAYRHGTRPRTNANTPGGGDQNLDDIRNSFRPAENDGANRANLSTIRLANYQETLPGAPVFEQVPEIGDDAAMTPEEAARRDRLRTTGTDVQIETLPDLDVIILRGTDRDVQKMMKIIEEIERLSAETIPVIDVYMLQHVRGDSLGILLNQVNMQVVGNRQGRVTVTPLVKPNAILIIGWGEAVLAVKELIAKLDQPVAPETQFQVFALKHAAANSARLTVQEFFTGRTGGLTGKVQVTADARTNSLIVQAGPEDLKEAAALIRELDQAGSESVNQARVFKLRNTLAADIATILEDAIQAARGGAGAGQAAQKSAGLELITIDAEGQKAIQAGMLTDVKITPDPRTNTLLVSAPAESMELVAALIRQLDEAPSEVAQLKVFRILNGDAASLVQMLRALLPAQVGIAPGSKLAGVVGETSLVPVRFSVDTRTNSIIATGSPGELNVIEALLLRLDSKDVQERKNAVYRLKNAPAPAVALAINDFLRSERQVQEATPGVVSPFQQIEREVVVVPESVSNSLILSATPRFFDEISVLIEKLDAQPPQVLIQVVIAEVALNNLDEFGVELGLQDSLLFDRSLLGNLVTTTQTVQQSSPSGILTSTTQNILGATNTPGYDFNNNPLGNSGAPNALANADKVGGQGLTSFNVGRVNSELGFGGLVLSASSESVSVLIRALQQAQRLEVLSRPQVTTLDNQPAFIQVGQRVPRITSTSQNQVAQTSQVVLENVGLILGVTPRISPDGKVVMEVDAEKSDLGPEAEGIPVGFSSTGQVIRSPRFNITTAQTTVSAANGETIILGGLITKSTSETSRRVPYLSDIPLVGELFRYDFLNEKRTELLIILTPHVILGGDDMMRLKRQETSMMHWCTADVQQIYGGNNLFETPNSTLLDTEVPTIYPDLNPRGVIEGNPPTNESLPTPLVPPPPRPSPPPIEGASASPLRRSLFPGWSVRQISNKETSANGSASVVENAVGTEAAATPETKKPTTPTERKSGTLFHRKIKRLP